MHQLVLVLTPSAHAPAKSQAAIRSYNFMEALVLFSAGTLAHIKFSYRLLLTYSCNTTATYATEQQNYEMAGQSLHVTAHILTLAVQAGHDLLTALQ
jgi:hypothetical protein